MANKTHPEYQYLDLLRNIQENGVKNIDEGTGAVSWSLFGPQMRFDLQNGFPLLTTKKVYWRGVLHELYWFFAGMTNIKYLVDNNVHIWDDYPYKIYMEKVKKGDEEELSKEEFIEKISSDDTFAEKHGELPRIYGEMWRNWPTKDGRGVDQLEWVINELREDPHARNAIVTSWNPEYLYAMAKPEEASRFPICHNMYQMSVKGGKLHLKLYQRSADMFLGVPFNIASYALLAHIVAQILDLEVGDFVHTFGDAHIYDNHMDQVTEQLSREPKPFSTLSIDDSVKEIGDFTPDMVNLEGYEHHDVLRGELTVAGGVKERDLEKDNEE
ncbi:MAG: thymidylate synthase [Candidatus Paceibacterota bacterium]